MDTRETYNKLRSKRSELKYEGKTREMILIQREIITAATELGKVEDIANAWNYLSTLLHTTMDYTDAEVAARRALEVYTGADVPKNEIIATYHFVLARILAAQNRFDEAVVSADKALEYFAEGHDPSDSFLKARIEEAERMRQTKNQQG